MSEEVRQRTPPDEEITEYWERLPGRENDLRGVEVCTGEALGDGWQVTIWAQEFFRQDPLGRELRQRLHRALSAVPGVTEAAEEDTETWIVLGSPSGEALCLAAANVLDELADRMRTARSEGNY
jgi:hypothetical protein